MSLRKFNERYSNIYQNAMARWGDIEYITTQMGRYVSDIDCSGNPNYPLGTKGDWYRVSVAGKIGGASGQLVDIGDRIECLITSAAGTHAVVGNSWIILEKNISSALLADLITGTSSSIYTSPASLTLAGISFSAATGIQFITGTTDVIKVDATTATNGLNIAGTVTNGINVSVATTTGLLLGGAATDGILISGACTDGIHISNAVNGLNLVSTLTTSNPRQNILTSRNISGTVTEVVAITNYANVFTQLVNHTGGDFVVTQTASSAGNLNLILQHITNCATAAPDVFASTALNIDVSANTANANADLDVTARAIDVLYALTETSGILRLGSTDLARIKLNVPINIGSSGPYNLTMLNLDGSLYVGNDTNTTLRGINLDLSGVKTVSIMRGIDVTMETGAGNLSMGYFVNAKDSANNYGFYAYCLNGANTNTSSLGLKIDKYVLVSGTPAGNKTNAGYAAKIDISSRNSCTDGSDAITTAGALHLITGTTNTATTAVTADTNSGKGIVLEVTASVIDDANSIIDSFSAGGIGIDYNLTRLTAGAITTNSWGGSDYLGIIAIDYDSSGAGTLTFANGTYNFFSVIASDNATVPVYGTCTMTGYSADLSGLDVTDSSLTLYGAYFKLPASGAATYATIASYETFKLVTTQDTKTITLNSRNYAATSGDIIGFQSKPAGNASGTQTIYGGQISPRFNDNVDGATLVGLQVEPILKGATVLALSGDMRALDVRLTSEGANTVAGVTAGLMLYNLLPASTYTGGVYPIYVTAAGSTQPWTALMEVPTALTNAANGAGADVYLDITINGVAARITAKFLV